MDTKGNIKHVIKNRFNRYVKNYKNDLNIDLDFIDAHDDNGFNFIYVTRENGSNIFNMFELEKHEHYEKIKYLFGYSYRIDILKGELKALSVFKDEPYIFHVTDREIKMVSYSEAQTIIGEHIKKQLTKV